MTQSSKDTKHTFEIRSFDESIFAARVDEVRDRKSATEGNPAFCEAASNRLGERECAASHKDRQLASANPYARPAQVPTPHFPHDTPYDNSRLINPNLKSEGSRACTKQTANADVSAQAVNTAPRNTKGAVAAIVVCILCLLIALAILFWVFFFPHSGNREGAPGQLAGKSAEEIQAELDRTVEEGMFNISIASFIAFPSGTSEGEFRIENVPANHYLMRVQIAVDDTDQVIYETDFIEPNHHIQTDTLDVALPAGTYNCTALFTAYDMDTEELEGQAAASVVIEVQS